MSLSSSRRRFLLATAATLASISPTARKALGFEELLTGDVEAMKRRTRNYARRQLTWMRKLADVQVIDVTDRSAEDVAAEVIRRWEGVPEPAPRALSGRCPCLLPSCS